MKSPIVFFCALSMMFTYGYAGCNRGRGLLNIGIEYSKNVNKTEFQDMLDLVGKLGKYLDIGSGEGQIRVIFSAITSNFTHSYFKEGKDIFDTPTQFDQVVEWIKKQGLNLAWNQLTKTARFYAGIVDMVNRNFKVQANYDSCVVGIGSWYDDGTRFHDSGGILAIPVTTRPLIFTGPGNSAATLKRLFRYPVYPKQDKTIKDLAERIINTYCKN